VFKKSLFILSVISCVFLCSSAFAEQFGDFTYTVSNNQVTITGYTGSGGDVVIPDTIAGMPVVSIGDSAFAFCNNLTSVTISGSSTSIGSYAFYMCTDLTNLIFAGSVSSIGNGSFYGCTGLAFVYFYGNALVMDGYVFYGCASGFTVYYTAGATEFTNPWWDYPTAVFDPSDMHAT
jgi:hypothetical protein